MQTSEIRRGVMAMRPQYHVVLGGQCVNPERETTA